MQMTKVTEILNEFVNKKFNGSLNIEFKKGEAVCISKAQKVLFDPYLPRPADQGKSESKGSLES